MVKFIVNGVEVDANGKPLAEKEQVSSTSGGLDTLKARVGTLEDERNTLTTELVNLKAQGVLPVDARERLIKVKGISDVLADQALDALKAEPEQSQGG